MLAHRTQFYWLASGLFTQPQPQKLALLQQVMRQLIATPLNAPWQLTLSALSTALTDNPTLEIEYNRLFVLAYPQPVIQPYGAYWLDAK